MERERGVALILALLVLSFLTILGSALLTTSTIDIWISDNYKTSTENLYIAEAGIDNARQLLRTSNLSASQLLAAAAGPDHQLSTATDLATLLASDDLPLIPSDPSMRSSGQPLLNSSGEITGYYYVWLRNDNADGTASTFDTNQTLTLISTASNWGLHKVIETTVQKGGFPDNANDSRMQSAAGLQSFAAGITRHATDLYSTTSITDYGSAAQYKIAVVNGNTTLGPGTGYGILLCQGDLNVAGNFTWNGLILVIGTGNVHWNGFTGTVNGGLFNGGVYNVTDAGQIRLANQPFPYTPIAIQER
ncbi:MAG TPA: PilX N-terminal domain-containing pilus assembly protein [Terriglobia bacterium]